MWTRPALLAGRPRWSSCLVLVTTGAFVTAAGPHAGATDRPIERFGDFYDAAWVHVRAAVPFATVFLILAVVLWRPAARQRSPSGCRVAGVVLTLCQLGVGEYQYRNGLPWEVIAVHVAIAAHAGDHGRDGRLAGGLSTGIAESADPPNGGRSRTAQAGN